MATADAAKYTNLSASAQIAPGAGTLYGVIVNSNSSGTLKLWDALTATGTVIMNTYTFAAGSSIINLSHVGISFYTGLFATIGGTADITIITKI